MLQGGNIFIFNDLWLDLPLSQLKLQDTTRDLSREFEPPANDMKKKVLEYKTIILSDVHLGTVDCKIKEVNHFLKHTQCRRLILNGDIIDGWQLNRRGGWTKDHTRFIRLVLKKMEKKETEVIYLRGNHDDILSRFLPLQFNKLRVVEDFIHETDNGRYLVLHGDVFDSVVQNFVVLAHIGDIGYKLLMTLNRFYNKFRAWRGKE